MDRKKKRWQIPLILAVIALTIYNILPTVFFYSQPLSQPVKNRQAMEIGSKALSRVNALSNESLEWVHSFNELLRIKAKSVQLQQENPQVIEVTFKNPGDAGRFKKFLPRAGSLIPFYPASLSLGENREETLTQTTQDPSERLHSPQTVYVMRKIPIQFDTQNPMQYFSFGELYDQDGLPTKAYQSLIEDRILELGLAIGGVSENAAFVGAALADPHNPRSWEFLTVLAQNILLYDNLFAENSTLARHFYASFTQGTKENKEQTIQALTKAMTDLKDRIQMERLNLKKESQEKGDVEQTSMLDSFQAKEDRLLRAISILKKQENAFVSGQMPWDYQDIQNLIENAKLKESSPSFALWVGDHNPVIESIALNYSEKKISLRVHSSLLQLKASYEKQGKTERADTLNQLVYNEIAKISRDINEKLSPTEDQFEISLESINNASSFLQLDLKNIAKAEASHIKSIISEHWHPEHKDLNRENYPIIDWQQYEKLSASQKNLHLVVYAPNLMSRHPLSGFKNNSIYVIAKDLGRIMKKFEANPQSESAQQLHRDLQSLLQLMKRNGFTGYPGTTYPLSNEFANDYIFEISDFYLPILKATREDFLVYGTQKFATLEFSDFKQRLITLNRIETAAHEDLIKWRDEYNAARVDPSLRSRFDVPKPTKNIFWSNLALSTRKYFRGDERKILQWGQDLSGGKTVQIALKDSNGKLVTKESDIKQGINELYTRVNKMGVSDVSIRQEGSYITLDFPGSQNMSASELVKASSMTFHIVNEKFASPKSPLYSEANQFLQEVWNEAVVTSKKDIESINQIAWNHLYGSSENQETVQPRSESAKALLNAGFRLANPNNPEISGTFNDSISKLAMMRGSNFADWGGSTNPLLTVFNNYALEGANLENVHAGYDASQGNFLSFQVTSSQMSREGQKIYPRNILYDWTRILSEEEISGSGYDTYTGGNGWRMAVVLNGQVISAPALKAPIKSSGMISGHFSTREVNLLVSDLKAGSLTFTPQIISEMSVSPELGLQERHQGILAAGIALLAVIGIMLFYYRFAGMVASIAVLFNLLIMWAALQNIGASLTLPGIAGIILTIGMAVDANVLVFERIREEFAITQKLAPSIHAGYKKAFSAIVDSNITTIIAALVLLHFDSGPIKGFAVTLIIGIVSSMFTALFMTKVFFTRWIQHPQGKKLNMLNLIKAKKFNFLRFGSLSIIISVALVALGGFALVKQKNSIFGMDFTGGFSATIHVDSQDTPLTKAAVEQALIKAGVSQQDIQVRELDSPSSLRIFLSKSLEQPGKPFYQLPIERSIEYPTYGYETNPKLVWLVDALKNSNIELTSSSYENLDQNFTNISGQMSDTMRDNAVIGLAIALACILLYITIRFELTYAISATIGLAFDVFISLGLLAILHFFGVPLQIDLNTVAALMTIVGYSLNDTIIVFDRVREDAKLMKGSSFKEIINHSLNITLSRTLLTSITTLVVLIALVCLGGSTIFGFSLIMAIGVVVGTLSTFFIASFLLALFQKKHHSRSNKGNAVLNGT